MSESKNRTFCLADFMLKCNILNTLKDNKNEEVEQGFTTGLVYSP